MLKNIENKGVSYHWEATLSSLKSRAGNGPISYSLSYSLNFGSDTNLCTGLNMAGMD